MTAILRLALLLFLACTSFSKGHADGAEVRIRPLMEGVWLHISSHTFEDGTRYQSNGLIIRDGDHLVLVDSAWGDARTAMLMDEIQSAIGLPVQLAVATHSHDDRAAGAALMKARGIRFYAFSKTRDLMQARDAVPPEFTLDMPAEEGATSRLGPLEILYPGAAHTHDNIVVWYAAKKLLFGGCAVREHSAQGIGYYKEGDPAHWGEAMALVKSRYGSAKTVVPGHGAVGDIGLLDHTAKLAADHLAAHSR